MGEGRNLDKDLAIQCTLGGHIYPYLKSMFLLTLCFNLIMREWEKELLATGCNYCQESFSSDFYILDKVLYSLQHEKISKLYSV